MNSQGGDIRERLRQGMKRAAERGRRPGAPVKVSDEAIEAVIHLPTPDAAAAVGLSLSQLIKRRRRIEERQERERTQHDIRKPSVR